MSADLRTHAGEAVAEHRAEPADGVGLAGERAAREDEHRLRLDAVDLLRQPLDKGFPEDDALHRRKPIDLTQHDLFLYFSPPAIPAGGFGDAVEAERCAWP